MILTFLCDSAFVLTVGPGQVLCTFISNSAHAKLASITLKVNLSHSCALTYRRSAPPSHQCISMKKLKRTNKNCLMIEFTTIQGVN